MKIKTQLANLLVIFIITFISVNGIAQDQKAEPTLREKYHLFDFWIGEWDVYVYGTDKIVGKSSILSINDSTALLENYSVQQGPYKGKSLNTYNQKTKQWEQYWTDNGGLILKLSGEFKDGKMVLLSFDGLVGNKISWSAEGEDVRQSWETSSDGGKTWTLAFDGRYVKR